MKNKFLLMTLPILLLSVIILVGGVSASWDYSTATPSSVGRGVGISVFAWVEFPDNNEGQTNQEIVDKVTGEVGGLNDPNSNINAAIENRGNYGKDTYGSADIFDGTLTAEELGLPPDTNFIIETVDANTKYLYTTDIQSGERGGLFSNEVVNIPIGEYVYAVYRSTLKLNEFSNKWENIKSEKGYAKSAYYKNDLVITTVNTPSFDPKTWQAGTLGKDMNEAIYTYYGYSGVATLENATDKIYYRFKPTKKGYFYIDIPEAVTGVSVKVYNDKRQLIKTTSGVYQGNNYWEINAKANKLYYIEMTGATDIPFTIA